MQNRLKECRAEKGLSQEELAAKAGVARTVVSFIETGKDVNVKLNTLSAIAKALDKQVSDIFLF